MVTTQVPAGGHRLRIPFKTQMLFGSRKFFSVFSGAMAAFMLYGPVTARNADHNAYRYLIGPWACPLVALAISLVLPFNPYGWSGRSERSLYRLDERDEDARRLREIIASAGCRRAALAAAGQLMGILSVTLWLCAIAWRASLDWHPVSPGLFFGVVGGVLFCWLFIRVRVVSWSLSTWWREYGDPATPGDGA